MNITEVQLVPIKPKDGLVAFASVVIDHGIYLGSIGVHTRADGTGYRITYPKKLVSTKQIDIYHPISKSVGQSIERAVITRAQQLLG